MLEIDINLIIGAAVGFVAAVILGIVRSSMRKRESERALNVKSKEAPDKDVIKHIEEKHKLAWIQLMATVAGDNSGSKVLRSMMDSFNTLLRLNAHSKSDYQTEVSDFQAGISQEKQEAQESFEANFNLIKADQDKFLSKNSLKTLLADTTFIGRDDDCNIRIDFDNFVSRKHAVIRHLHNEYYIHNLSSTNGLFVNHKLVDREGIRLCDEDFIIVGNTILKYSMSEPENLNPTQTIIDPDYLADIQKIIDQGNSVAPSKDEEAK
jgi:pSer/pThr/pTyr-binding forkhead associated (FHA) protein